MSITMGRARLWGAISLLLLGVGGVGATGATAAAPPPLTVPAIGPPMPAAGSDCLPGSTRISPKPNNSQLRFLGSDQEGWRWVEPTGGASGYLTSTITPPTPANVPTYRLVSPSPTVGTTYLRVVYRGSFATRGAYVRFNSWLWFPPPPADPASWTTKVFNVTGAVFEENTTGPVLALVNDPAGADSAATSTFEVAEVEVYACTPLPSKAKGDFDGDGIMDVVMIDKTTGALTMLPNYGTTGKLGYPVRMMEASSGWDVSDFDWMGNPGDLNGDGFADLLVRDRWAQLWVYFGDGVHGFTSRLAIGSAWDHMWSIVPTGDMDGDGNRDLLGLEAPGNLYRYTLVTGPRPKIINKTLIGVQFYEFKQLISSGDYNGDGTPDILGIKHDDTMWGYYTTAGSGRLSSHGKFLGSGWKMKSVSSPGDFDGNGFDDILALGPTNDLVIYYVKDGHWAGTSLLASNFFPKLLA